MPSLLSATIAYIRRHELLRPGDRVGLAVSAGADSVTMLRLLLEARAELGVVLSVVHFHHQIRGPEADADQAFVAALVEEFGLPFHLGSADAPAYARQQQLSLEAAARHLRYDYFRRLLLDNLLDRVATAHTCDDQAETVLLRFLRGAGTRGLAGIYPQVARVTPVTNDECGRGSSTAIVRPLLGCRRQQLRAYLNGIGQAWREDASNTDLSFTRNRVRLELLPQLERDFNPSVARVMAETAEVARAEEEFWSQEVARLLPQMLLPLSPSRREGEDHPALVLSVAEWSRHPLALRRRLLRAAAERAGVKLDFHHIEQLAGLAAATSRGVKIVELPGELEARRQGGELWFQPRCVPRAAGYGRVLSLPGCVEIPEVGARLRASLVAAEASESELLNPALLEMNLQVRNWRAGDRYHPGHAQAPRKLKALLQARHIGSQFRRLWPVVVSGQEIVWVPGFPLPDRLRLEGEGPGVLLQFEPVPKE